MTTAAITLAGKYLRISGASAFSQTASLVLYAHSKIHDFVSRAPSFVGINSKGAALAQQVSNVGIEALSVSLTACGGYSLLLRGAKQIPFYRQTFQSALSLPRRELAVLLGAVAVYEVAYKGIFSLIGSSNSLLKSDNLDPILAGPQGIFDNFDKKHAELGAYLAPYIDENSLRPLNRNQNEALRDLKILSDSIFNQKVMGLLSLLVRSYCLGFFQAPLITSITGDFWNVPYSLLSHLADVNSQKIDTSYTKTLATNILANKKPISVALEAIAWVGTCFMCTYALGMNRQDALKMVGKLFVYSILERLASYGLSKGFEPRRPSTIEGVQGEPIIRPGESLGECIKRLQEIINGN